MSRSLLREGAHLVMTGRSADKLNAFIEELAEEGFKRDRMVIATGDSADPEVCRATVAAAVQQFGRIDVLINNAGAAGPRRTLRDIPFSESEMRANGDDQTMFDAAMNLLAGPWHMVRAALPHMSDGGSIVNVSTIFSRTHYYGRIPYVVPKSGLNALSLGLAKELGDERGIRVNTVFPGPIESERIDTVFSNMDALQSAEPGTTSKEFRGLMITKRDSGEGDLEYRYPTPSDVASTITYLASGESAALSGHSFEVTNGMQVPAQSRSKLVSWPDKRLEDLSGSVVLILGGTEYDEALAFAERHLESGAEVVLAFRSLEALGMARSLCASRGLDHIHLQHLEPLRGDSADRTFDYVRDNFGRLDGVVVLPRSGNGQHGYSLSTAGDEDIQLFVRDEIVSPVAFASALSRYLDRWGTLKKAPALTYVTNATDGHGNYMNEVKRAAIEAMIRIWRHEDETLNNKGERNWAMLPNQLVRFDNTEDDNLAFSTDWAATLTNRVRRMDAINLWVPESIKRATGKGSMPLSIQRVLPGLHKGRTAVITGGSLGIGLQLGRFLAIAGARVLLSARSKDRLESAREDIVEELRGVGYPNPEERVHILGDVDVGSEEALERLYEHSMDLFGHVDFLINNAGISGAEEMVVDMSLEDWNRTMFSNLISNYSLIRKYAPAMKANGYGIVLNVSSYFGGEKYVAVAYPNRADYAVSKAGQRAMVESFSRFLGPEVQLNAIAPGPVDGDRLSGVDGRPGLFARRARLILHNRRLNAVHAAIIKAVRGGAPVETVLTRLSRNSTSTLSHDHNAPSELREVALACAREGDGVCTWDQYLLTPELAERLLSRLRLGGYLIGSETWQETPDGEAEHGNWLKMIPPDDVPFLPQKVIEKEAEKIGRGVLSQLHLGTMPTEAEVAQATVFFLADRAVSGETFMPSGGLSVERSTTEREMFGSPKPERLEQMRGRTVWIVGEHPADYIAAAVHDLVVSCGVAHVVVLCRSDAGGKAIKKALKDCPSEPVHIVTTGDKVEEAMDEALIAYGGPTTVVSMPNEALPDHIFDLEKPLSPEEFARVIEENLTQHFRISRKASLYDGCRLVLVSPDVPFGKNG
ncbi:MAG: SDR family oxidoreductase, partial [Myxococcota bacterium]